MFVLNAANVYLSGSRPLLPLRYRSGSGIGAIASTADAAAGGHGGREGGAEVQMAELILADLDNVAFVSVAFLGKGFACEGGGVPS